MSYYFLLLGIFFL